MTDGQTVSNSSLVLVARCWKPFVNIDYVNPFEPIYSVMIDLYYCISTN